MAVRGASSVLGRPVLLLGLLVCTGIRPGEAFQLQREIRRSSPGLVTWSVVSRAVAKRKGKEKREKGKEKRDKSKEKRELKIAWPWRKRPQKQPNPLVVIRQRAVGVCQRVNDSVRRLHQAGVMWWFSDHHIDRRWPMRVLFLASNVAYLVSGFALLERTVSRGCPPLLGYLMMAACGYSTTYHAMQCLFGVGSSAAKSTGRLDVGLAALSAVYFFLECGCDTALMRSLAIMSGAMFVDVFQLGYTVSHSLWHLLGAALAFQGGSEWTRRRRKLKWLPGAGPAPVRLVPVPPARPPARQPMHARLRVRLPSRGRGSSEVSPRRDSRVSSSGALRA